MWLTRQHAGDLVVPKLPSFAEVVVINITCWCTSLACLSCCQPSTITGCVFVAHELLAMSCLQGINESDMPLCQ
jgi:hypothetical protein